MTFAIIGYLKGLVAGRNPSSINATAIGMLLARRYSRKKFAKQVRLALGCSRISSANLNHIPRIRVSMDLKILLKKRMESLLVFGLNRCYGADAEDAQDGERE